MSLRPDLQAIADMVPAGSRVLDIGCGEGELLAWLTRNKQVDGRGIELKQSGVNKSIAQGLSVIQGDADTDLGYYPDQSYDYAILSRTLQTLRKPHHVISELVRIARHAVVSVPNFGHWKNRLYLSLNGRMPVTKALTYEWYDTPNIHFCTITDFIIMCEGLGISVEKRLFLSNNGVVSDFEGKNALANLLGEQGLFMLKKD